MELDKTKEIKQACLAAIEGITKIANLIRQDGMRETTNTVILDAFPQEVAAFFAKYPLALQAFKELQDDHAKDTTALTKVTKKILDQPQESLQTITALKTALIYMSCGFFLALCIVTDLPLPIKIVSSVILTTIFIRSICAQAQQSPPGPQEVQMIQMATITNKLMPWLPVVNKILKIAHDSNQYAVSVEALDYYKLLIDSLKPNQQESIPNYRLVQALLAPEILVEELKLIKLLTNAQLAYLYGFCSFSQVPISKEFTQLDQILTAEQKKVDKAMPNRFLIAKYNPLILFFDDIFMHGLDAKQLDFMKSLVTQKKIDSSALFLDKQAELSL